MEFTLMTQYVPAPLFTMAEIEALSVLPIPRLIRQVAEELPPLPPPPRLIRQVAQVVVAYDELPPLPPPLSRYVRCDVIEDDTRWF
jgi:hypothetical protein